MKSTLSAAARLLAASVALLLFATAAQAESRASTLPGSKGTITFKPTDWKGNADPNGKPVSSWWKDSDGIDPGVAGCHIGVTEAGVPNGRSFGEACLANGLLVESNPSSGTIHEHANDIGHPDTFDCNEWCIAVKKPSKGGMCVPVSGPAPCAASARCECN